jgi:hypothetical protein
VSTPLMETPGKDPPLSAIGGWWPRGMGQWALTVSACPLAVITLALAVYFLHLAGGTSLPYDLGSRALAFSLHLLVVTIVALGLGLLAGWLRARLAARVLGLVAVLSLFLALWPSVAMWQLARQENVPLSLGTYLTYAAHRDIGRPQLERTVLYGTSADGTKLVLDVWRPDLLSVERWPFHTGGYHGIVLAGRCEGAWRGLDGREPQPGYRLE